VDSLFAKQGTVLVLLLLPLGESSSLTGSAVSFEEWEDIKDSISWYLKHVCMEREYRYCRNYHLAVGHRDHDER